MWRARFILLAIFLLPLPATATARAPAASVSDLWLDVSLGPPLVDWFNSVARPSDIARLDNPTQLNLFDRITVGRKLLVFKSTAEAEQLLPGVADQLDIIGYNLEHDPASPANEQADPVSSVRQMRKLADEYGLQLAFGPDHDFALSDGPAIAPFVDIFVLQVQRVQTQSRQVFDFVLPLIPRLREANPNLQISIQVRTEGDVVAIADLVSALQDNLDGVSILTSPTTVPVAENLVAELRRRRTGSPTVSLTAVPSSGTPAIADGQGLLIVFGVLSVIGGLVGLMIILQRRGAPP
jgi:hypothetical protein